MSYETKKGSWVCTLSLEEKQIFARLLRRRSVSSYQVIIVDSEFDHETALYGSDVGSTGPHADPLKVLYTRALSQLITSFGRFDGHANT